jgi:hypothetical protein
MGWNDHSPYFEMIEERQEELMDEAFFNGKIISLETAYMQACDEIASEMQSFYANRMNRIDAIGE